jgi:predicted deacylase
MASARGAVVAERALRSLAGRVGISLMLGVLALGLGAQDFPDDKPASGTASKPVPAAVPTPSVPAKPKPPPRNPPRKPKSAPAAASAPTSATQTGTTAAAERSTLAEPPKLQDQDAAPEAAGESLPLLGAPDDVAMSSFVSALEEVPQTAVALQLLGESIEAGSRHELRWASSQSFDGAVVTTPVIVLHGVKPGPRLCMTAAVHGDELNGIEIIRRVTNEVDVAELAGTVIAVPIVNYLGYSRASRYLPDRRDLNRYFPGSRTGSSASRIAYGFFNDIARHCHAVVDFHTGSFDRSNLPQVRGDLRRDAVLAFTRDFGATAVLHSPGSSGMLRRALTDVGIPAITFEVGSPLRLEPSEIDFGVQAMHTLMHKMGMTRSFRMWAEPQALFYAAKWVRVDSGGMLFSEVALGDRVRVGQRLGKVIDPIQNLERAIVSPVRGKVLGMALNQIVLPGFAAYHLGVETSEQRMAEEAARAAAALDAGAAGIDDPAEDDGAGTPIERAPDEEDGER